VIQGLAGSLLGPAVAAVGLGLVGHDALAERLGRNQRFASIGSLATAAVLGAAGYLLSTQAIFLVAATLWLPLLVAVVRIRSGDIHFGRSCGAPDHHAKDPPRISRAALLKDHRLVTFAACLFLFQLANASLLPQMAQTLVQAHGHASSPIMSAMIVGPQIIVALLAPWVGRTAASAGRRPLLIIGLAAVPIRAALFLLMPGPALLIAIQLLDGLSGATLGVLTALAIADLTSGTRPVQSGPGSRRRAFRGRCLTEHVNIGSRGGKVRPGRWIVERIGSRPRRRRHRRRVHAGDEAVDTPCGDP
jgi:hypothetical protein